MRRKGIPQEGASMQKATRGEINNVTRFEEEVKGYRVKLTLCSVTMQ